MLWVCDLRAKYRSCRKPRFLENLNLWKTGSIGSFFAIFAFLVAALTQEYYHDAETAELWWFIAALGMISVLKKKNSKLEEHS